MLVIIDNYDSFTYNLVHFLGELGADSRVFRNDAVTPRDVLALGPTGIVLSPGPAIPTERESVSSSSRKPQARFPFSGCVWATSPLVKRSADTSFALPRSCTESSASYGTMVPRVHGPAFGVPATRYHSLVIDGASVPTCLRVTAETDDGVVMGVSHKDLPVHGVQFHPESIASEAWSRPAGEFLRLTGMDETQPVESPKRAAPLEMHS